MVCSTARVFAVKLSLSARIAEKYFAKREAALSLEAIAARSGFEHPEYLSVVFKRETGVSPRVYRQGARR